MLGYYLAKFLLALIVAVFLFLALPSSAVVLAQIHVPNRGLTSRLLGTLHETPSIWQWNCLPTESTGSLRTKSRSSCIVRNAVDVSFALNDVNVGII
eukprot:3508728-Amphidinium_carterae.1